MSYFEDFDDYDEFGNKRRRRRKSDFEFDDDFEDDEDDLSFVTVSFGNNRFYDNFERYPVDYVYSTAQTAAPMPKDFVVINFETANGKSNSICQIGIAIVENNVITELKDFLVRPPSSKFTNSHIHGITFEDVENAPNFKELWSEFKGYIQGRTVTSYNLDFDMGCLFAVLDKYKIQRPDFMAFDILANVRYCKKTCPNSVFSSLENCKLVTVAKRLRLRHNAHNANSDSEVAAKIQLYISTNLPEIKTRLNFPSIQSIFDAVAKDKLSMDVILAYTKYLANKERDLKYDKYKDLLRLLEQVAAKFGNGILYRDCGLLYEKFEKFPRALAAYKTALSLNKNLRLKSKIQELEQRRN